MRFIHLIQIKLTYIFKSIYHQYSVFNTFNLNLLKKSMISCYSCLIILLPNAEPAQNLSIVTNGSNPFLYIFRQELWSMYGKDASNKIGLGRPFSVLPQPTTCKSRKQLYNLQL